MIAVGACVAYTVFKKQKTIEGCVETAENPLRLTDLKDKKPCVLESERFPVKPGQHLKVKGKKGKDKSATLRLRVKKIVRISACARRHLSHRHGRHFGSLDRFLQILVFAIRRFSLKRSICRLFDKWGGQRCHDFL